MRFGPRAALLGEGAAMARVDRMGVAQAGRAHGYGARDGVHWDTREFNRALVQYAAASRKAWPQICDDKARDVAIATVKMLPRAVAEQISWLEFESWWPRYISRRMNLAMGLGAWDHDDALAKSDGILRGRKASVAFMKGGFGKAARALGKASGPDGKRHAMSHASAILATVARPVTEMTVVYDSDKGGADAAYKQQMAFGAIQRAMDLVARDMMVYVERKMRELGRPFSA